MNECHDPVEPTPRVEPPPLPAAGTPAPAAEETPRTVVSALLRCPHGLAAEWRPSRATRLVGWLVLLATFTLGGYGALMGSFSGGHQLWLVPLKVLGGLLVSCLLCLPSLYIFVCLGGGNVPFGRVAGALLQGVALAGILMAGFAPVAWVFAQSTYSAAFMGFLHLLFWIASLRFALRLLAGVLAFENGQRVRSLFTWGLVFILVTLQMTTTLRPLVGDFPGLHLAPRQCFAAYWWDELWHSDEQNRGHR